MESKEKIYLLDQIRYVKSYNERLNSITEEYNNIFINQFNLQDEFQITQEDIPHINISRIQRKIIEYRLEEGNSILEQAVKKRKSIENSLYDLSRDNEGILRFLPKFPDKEHNEKVFELIDLIGRGIHIEYLYKRPIDNLFKLTALPFIFGGLFYFAGDFRMNIAGVPKNIANFTFLFSGAFGFCCGVDFCLRFPSTNEDLPWENAKYLDDKIKELF